MIFVTGDIHLNCDIEKLNEVSFPEQHHLTKDDFVIIAGDTGLTWDKSWRTKHVMEWFNSKNFTTLFVDGNHENFDILNSLEIESWMGGKVHKLSESVIHLMRGQTYNINGKVFFTFGGAFSCDINKRIPGRSWWNEELPSKMEILEGINNLKEVKNKVDYIITHDCSNTLLTKFTSRKFIVDADKELKDLFEYIEENIKYKQWFFGHHHIDKKIDEKHIALFNTIERIV